MILPIIEVKELSFAYPKQTEFLLKNLNFTIEQGDFVSIVGPNGRGKTTLVKLLLGLLKPSQGSVWIAPSQQLDYVSQTVENTSPVPISVLDVVLMGAMRLDSSAFCSHSMKPNKSTQTDFPSRSLWEKIQALFPPFTSKIFKDKALYWLEKFNLVHKIKQPFFTLSLGQKKKVLLARSLLSASTILILDEPTAGLDVLSAQQLTFILEQLSESMTLIVISHDMHFLAKQTQKVLLLQEQLKILDRTEFSAWLLDSLEINTPYL